MSNFQNRPAKRNVYLPLPPCGKCASQLFQTQVQENKHCRFENKLTKMVKYRFILIINNVIIVVALVCELRAMFVACCKGCWTKANIALNAEWFGQKRDCNSFCCRPLKPCNEVYLYFTQRV